MREPAVRDVDKDEILCKCFAYLSANGLEKTSMRNLCKETGLGMGSIYYWFENKDNLIVNATEWGLHSVVGELFEYVYKYIDNLECVVITFSEVAMKYKRELRFIYQVAASTQYDDEIRNIVKNSSSKYEKYADTMSKHFNCNKNEILPFVHLFVSAVLDYVIWLDKDKLEIELAAIYKAIKSIIEKK